MSEFELEGPWRRPTNTSAHQKGGIHDDETAQDLGFTGGTVAGSIHMEQFPPFLIEHLGEQWLESGTLSLYFRTATTDGAPVRCVGRPQRVSGGLTRMDVGMVTEDGTLVMDGTASVGGPDPGSALRRRLPEVRPATDLRVLADVVVDRWSEPVPARLDDAAIDRQLAVVTEPMAIFGVPGDARRAAPLSALIQVLRVVEPALAPPPEDFVGLFGAIELAFAAGQPVTGEDYLVSGRALALSESPKTEIFWMESVLSDADSGRERVRMIKMDRVMKASSPLWAEEA
jgi:hypothetical protein